MINLPNKYIIAKKRIEAYINGYGKINNQGKGLINLIDIGSASGKLPSPWYENSGYIAKLLCFDPQEESNIKGDLISKSIGLWKEEGQVDLHLFSHPSGASLYRQNTEYVEENFEELKNRGNKEYANTWFERSRLKDIIKIQVNTLDTIIESLDFEIEFDFLKIDAQGAEYDILKGAENFLKNSCIGLHLELFNIPLYKDILLEPQVTDYLRTKGFQLIKKMPAHGTFNSQNDCLYLKLDTQKNDRLNLIKRIYAL